MHMGESTVVTGRDNEGDEITYSQRRESVIWKGVA